jgi:hypothetical protein
MSQHRLMAQMNAIKGANGYRATAMMWPQIMPAADELHPRPSS